MRNKQIWSLINLDEKEHFEVNMWHAMYRDLYYCLLAVLPSPARYPSVILSEMRVMILSDGVVDPCLKLSVAVDVHIQPWKN